MVIARDGRGWQVDVRNTFHGGPALFLVSRVRQTSTGVMYLESRNPSPICVNFLTAHNCLPQLAARKFTPRVYLNYSVILF